MELLKECNYSLCSNIVLSHKVHFDGLVQDCSNSSVLAMELLQSCTNKPLIYGSVLLEISSVFDMNLHVIAWSAMYCSGMKVPTDLKWEILLMSNTAVKMLYTVYVYMGSTLSHCWGGWGCEVSCGGHHRARGKTTTGSALDGAVFDIAQILAYLVHKMSRSQLHLGFGPRGGHSVRFHTGVCSSGVRTLTLF